MYQHVSKFSNFGDNRIWPIVWLDIVLIGWQSRIDTFFYNTTFQSNKDCNLQFLPDFSLFINIRLNMFRHRFSIHKQFLRRFWLGSLIGVVSPADRYDNIVVIDKANGACQFFNTEPTQYF